AERKRAREVSPDPASTPPSETPPLLSPPRAGDQENIDSEDYDFLEEEIIKDDASEEEMDSEGENLFDGEIMERDYQPNPLLDTYDIEDIDDDDIHEPMPFDARRRVEMIMDQLDQMGAQGEQLY
ncbi:7377_t:CDS:2, partial [Scutellospora calospora]